MISTHLSYYSWYVLGLGQVSLVDSSTKLIKNMILVISNYQGWRLTEASSRINLS